MKRSAGGRELKSLSNLYEETRLRVACYVSMSDKRWIKVAWKRETMKENNPVKDEAIMTMQSKGKIVEFDEKSMILEGTIDKKMETSLKTGEIMIQKGTSEKRNAK